MMNVGTKIDHRPWPMDDHEAMLEFAKGKESALEFGPGASTLTFFIAGVKIVHSYEYDPVWKERAIRLLRPSVPQGVEFEVYDFKPVDYGFVKKLPRYDIALVDSPKGTRNPPGQPSPRLITLKWALACADTVLLHDCDRPGEQLAVQMAGVMLTEKLTEKLWRVSL